MVHVVRDSILYHHDIGNKLAIISLSEIIGIMDVLVLVAVNHGDINFVWERLMQTS